MTFAGMAMGNAGSGLRYKFSEKINQSFVIVLLCKVILLGTVLPAMSSQTASHTDSKIIPLWLGGPAESSGLNESEQMKNRGTPAEPDRRYSNITEPDLEIFHAAHPNGCGVVIIPGGGYGNEVMDKEGREVARWFNTIGVSAYVLKYRLPNTKTHRFGHEVPLRDAQRALRLVRFHSKEWKLDSGRIGVAGFSAGGHLASTLGTHFDAGEADAKDPVERKSCRPDFMVLGYPVISMENDIAHAGSRQKLLGTNPSPELVSRFSNELQVASNTPPVFIICASDDPVVKVENSLRFYQAACTAGVPVEIHIFECGEHGFGLRSSSRAGRSWPPLCESWLRERGLLGKTTDFKE